MQGGHAAMGYPASQKAHILRLMEELDLPQLEPCSERIAGATYFMLHEDEFKGDETCLPFLEHLARLVAKDLESRWELEGKRRLLGLDIGANIGAMMPMVIECCGSNALGGTVPVHIVAFEPNPVNLPMLESEVQRLRTDPRFSVSVCETVASDAAGPARFHVNRKRNFAGNQHGSVHRFEGEYDNEDADVRGGDSSAYLQLAADTVDHLLWGEPSGQQQAAAGRSASSGAGGRRGGLALAAGFDAHAAVDFVKIDTEGHEWSVLLGMVETLRRTRFVFFEVSHLLRRVGVTVRELVDWLEELGFHTYRVGKKVTMRISGRFYHPIYETRLFWSNCLAVRQDEPLTEELLRPYALGSREL